jgi:hypothetical protein
MAVSAYDPILTMEHRGRPAANKSIMAGLHSQMVIRMD